MVGDFVIKKKEPIYMKWWIWIAIFFVTAVIVNYTTDYIEDYHSSSPHQPEAEVIPYQIDVDESTPVNANYNGSNTFLVGTDLPAGEYFVMANNSNHGYILLTNNRNLAAENPVWQQHFERHTMVNLVDGQYLTTKNATLIPLENAIIPNFENGTLQAGTYRVGIDIPPGVFTIFPLDNKIGFFSTASSSHHLDNNIIQTQNFSDPVVIALNIGDYFTLMRAEIRK